MGGATIAGRGGVTCGRGFFDLQIEFAEAVSALSGIPLARALLDYTNFYIRFGLGRDFDSSHAIWRQYVAGLEQAADRGEWSHRFYEARDPGMAAPGVVAAFGCFSYARLDDDRIRLHFHNCETDGQSPLARARRDRRVADLTALFTHIKRVVSRPVRVVGASWLYNLDAYRRLFPAPYVATARAVRGRFRHMPLWGQFVDRHGEIRERVADQFRQRLGRQSSLENLDWCFPLQVLSVESPVQHFYECYGI